MSFELTAEEAAARTIRLEQSAHEGAIMREFAAHPGFKMQMAAIEKEQKDLMEKLARATTPQEAWDIKVQMAVWVRVVDLIKQKISKGDAANIALRLEKEPS